MTLTRRGWLVLAAIAAGMYMAAEYGARSLNAMVAPLLVALVAALIQVWMLDPPRATRRVPEPGFVGDERTVELSIDAESPVGATVSDEVGGGLSATGNEASATIGREPIEYSVSLDRRGEHSLGPLSVAMTDVLGLAYRRFEYDYVDQLLVYPRVFRLDPSGEGIAVLPERERRHAREEFDGLREYRRGDALRDVHWKSSAKRADDDLLVREYFATEREGELVVAVAADHGRSDDAAAVAASVALYLLDLGFAVGLRTPDATLPPGSGAAHRQSLLATLARMGAGQPPDGSEGRPDDPIDAEELLVRAPSGVQRVYVETDDASATFGRLVAIRGSDWVRYERPLTPSPRGDPRGADPDSGRGEVAP